MKGLAWWLVAQGVLVVLAVGAPIAYAQTPPAGAAYPNRPITLLHAYSAGGSSAVILRALAENAGKALGQRMIVEDRPGAGGALAPTHMLKSGKPDGYILSQLPQPLLRIPHIQKTEFDVLNDFTWIIRIIDYTYAMVVRPDAPWKTVGELVKHAQANPGKLTYATSGVGVTMHMAMENCLTCCFTAIHADVETINC